MRNSEETHLKVVYCILQYLKGTPRKGILFKKGNGIILEACIDADYAGSIDSQRFTSRYCTFFGGHL